MQVLFQLCLPIYLTWLGECQHIPEFYYLLNHTTYLTYIITCQGNMDDQMGVSKFKFISISVQPPKKEIILEKGETVYARGVQLICYEGQT